MTGDRPDAGEPLAGEAADAGYAASSDALPVLGLFRDEAGLRDHLALNLDLIEPGLTLVKVEYTLENPDGAGGRVDILARDRFGHVVCIEVKRSDQSARAALNELSKYVTLLHRRDRVTLERIRCVVVSTHWSELLLPLSYFAAFASFDVEGVKAVAPAGSLKLEPVELPPAAFLPQLCPAMEVAWFDDAAVRDRYVELLADRSARLPFVRLALLLLEPGGPLSPERSRFAVVACVWRIADAHLIEIEAATGQPVGSDFPYAAEGWEAELDGMGWIDDVFGEVGGAFDFNYATSESLANMLGSYRLERVERLGDWPRAGLIDDDAQLLDAVLSRSPLGGSDRRNRHVFDATVTPSIVPSWRAVVAAFLDFIAFEPTWREEAEAFLAAVPAHHDVRLYAFDKNHMFFAIHQARAHPGAALSHFAIEVLTGNHPVVTMVGFYRWDGSTCPADAREAIEAVHGSVRWATLGAGSAVDVQRYDAAMPLHGFQPEVEVVDDGEDEAEEGRFGIGDLRGFVDAHPGYARNVSELLERMGPLPTDPRA